MTTITHKPPTDTDDRYQLFGPTTGDVMKDLFPIGFAKKTASGFSFWSSHSSIDPIPEELETRTMKELKETIAKVIDSQSPEDRIWNELNELAGELSPENLCCDGELRGRALMQKKARLDARWADCEKRLGRKVAESEVWDRYISRRK